MDNCFRARFHGQIVIANLCDNPLMTSCFDAHIIVRDGQCPSESRFSHQSTQEVDDFWPVVAAFGPFSQPFGAFAFFQVCFGPVEGFTLSWSKSSQHLEDLEAVFYGIAVAE